jgi:hypothetical protein
MASSERKRQSKLAKKAAKRKQHHEALRRSAAESAQAMSVTGQLALAARAPIHECLVPEELFASGIGTAVVSRKLPNGNIVAAGFLLDVWCLGVKNAFVRVESAFEYPTLIRNISENETLAPFDPACARKLVEEAVAYAADLGFPPHPDYELSRRIFGDIDKDACPTEFHFGKDGKPWYMSGPYETPAMARRIVETLRQRCGGDGFHYMVGVDSPADLADWPDARVIDSEELGEEEPGEEEQALEEGTPELPSPER